MEKLLQVHLVRHRRRNGTDGQVLPAVRLTHEEREKGHNY